MRQVSSRLESRLKPLFHDLIFESLRCGIRANVSLLKDNPAGIPAKLEPYARQIVQLETANPDMAVEVRVKFTGLLNTYPVLKEQYQAQGGKMFLSPATPTN